MIARSSTPLISLSWQSIAYGAGILARQAILFGTLRFFTIGLSLEQYGAISVTQSFLSFADVLSNAGLPGATFRLYNDDNTDEWRKHLLGSSLFLFTGLALLFSLAAWLFSPWISGRLFSTSNYASLISYAAWVMFIGTLINFGQIILRLQVRPLLSSSLLTCLTVLQIIFSMLFIKVYRLGADGYLLGQLLGGLITLGLMIWILRRSIPIAGSRRHVRDLLLYALPVIPSEIALWSLGLVDRKLIESFAGLNAVAVYDVGYKVGMLVGFAVMPFISAWSQFAFSTMNKADAREIFSNVLTYMTSIFVFVSLGVMTFAKELVDIVAPSTYSSAITVVGWIALSQVSWGIFQITSIGLRISKQTAWLGIVIVGSALANITLNMILIPGWGILGAAVAKLAAYVILVVAGYSVSEFFYSFPLDVQRLFKVGIGVLVTMLAASHLGGIARTVESGFWIRLMCLMLFPLTLAAMNFTSQQISFPFSAMTKVVQRMWKTND